MPVAGLDVTFVIVGVRPAAACRERRAGAAERAAGAAVRTAAARAARAAPRRARLDSGVRLHRVGWLAVACAVGRGPAERVAPVQDDVTGRFVVVVVTHAR